MRPEVISEAINNISDEYKLEALELHNQATVSEVTNMTTHKSTKRFVGVGIAASLTLALGITAFATDFFGIRTRDAEPEETLEVVYTVDGEGPQTITYDTVSKYVSFDGPTTCNKVEYMLNYLPDGFTHDDWGNPTGWKDGRAQFFDANYNVYNVELFYTAQFGSDGFMFFDDEISDTEQTSIGEYDAIKMRGHREGDIVIPDGIVTDDDTHYAYDECYIVMQHPDGYIFFLAGDDMDELETIAENIEIRQTGGTISYDESENHSWYMCNGVG